MSNLPSIKRFFSEDYPDAPTWFQQFLNSLNLYTDPIYTILNGNVTANVNTADEIYTFDFVGVSSTATLNTFSFYPQRFAGKPNGVIVGQCLVNSSNGVATAVGGPFAIDWVWAGSQISIIAMYNLTANTSYTITLRIF